MDQELLKDLANPSYQAFTLSDCVAKDILFEKKAIPFSVAVEVQIGQGTVFYNVMFGGKQINVYSSKMVSEHFFKAKAIDRI